MISLSKSGGTVTFTFDGNSTYLQNGTIEVPLNSLSLIVDESGMATFRKSASNDIFVSALYSEFGMTKEELEVWYKENMVGSAGIDSGAVQTMIDESISGKADTSALTVYFDGVEYDSSAKTINFYNDGVLKDSIDASDFVIDGMIDDVRIETISGASYLVIDFNTASEKEDIQIPLSDIFNPDNYYDKTAIDGIVSGLNEDIATKLDASAYTPTDLSQYWTSAQTESAITEAVSGKVSTTDFNTYSGNVATALGEKASQSTVDALNGTVTAHTADTTIHVTSADKTAWNAKSDFSGSYNDLTNKPTIPTSASQLPNDANYQTENDVLLMMKNLNDTVQEEISEATSGKADTSAVTAIQDSLSGYVETSAITTSVTSASTDSEIPTAKAVFDAIPSGGGMDDDTQRLISTALVDLNDRKIDASEVRLNYQRKGDYATKSELAAKANASEVMTLEKAKENELVTATALNSINERLIALEAAVQALQALHNNE